MFLTEAHVFLRQVDYEDYSVGHDFWLTRNRYGAGFWDRGWGVVGEKLTKIAESFRERSAYVGDDNKVHIE